MNLSSSFRVENFSVENLGADAYRRYMTMLQSPVSDYVGDEGWNVRLFGISLSQLEHQLHLNTADTELERKWARDLVAHLEGIQADFVNRTYEGKYADCFENTKRLVAKFIKHFASF